ncbi:MAG: molybdate ABC transporter substrate-binding protein [Nitrospirae bacterium]|nr:molybdate ABC transporter substrate-binding protein [Nitrospirota bacterium]
MGYKLKITIVIIFLFLPTIIFAGSRKEITISAAISLKSAFEEIGRLYESKSGIKCVFNFGASGDLLKQIAGGAPVDVFASAAQKDMDEAYNQGLMVTATRADFAANNIVLIAPISTKTSLRSFIDLNNIEIKKIAVGNPKTVPAGRYAEEVINSYKLFPMIKDKLVYTENVRQVLDYVAMGEVDAGIVYATDAAIRSKEVVIIAEAPENTHKQVIYPIAIVKDSKNNVAARGFISILMSEEGRKILQKYGFKFIK